MTNDNHQRGKHATVEFLERVGIEVIDTDVEAGGMTIDVLGDDDGVTVLVFVTVRENSCSGDDTEVAIDAERAKRAVETLRSEREISDEWRVDAVTILIIGEDRALLRHQLGVMSSS